MYFFFFFFPNNAFMGACLCTFPSSIHADPGNDLSDLPSMHCSMLYRQRMGFGCSRYAHSIVQPIYESLTLRNKVVADREETEAVRPRPFLCRRRSY